MVFKDNAAFGTLRIAAFENVEILNVRSLVSAVTALIFNTGIWSDFRLYIAYSTFYEYFYEQYMS